MRATLGTNLFKIDGFYYLVDSSQPIKVNDWYFANQAPRLCVDLREANEFPYGHTNSKGEITYDMKYWNRITFTNNTSLTTIAQMEIVDGGEDMVFTREQMRLCWNYAGNFFEQQTDKFGKLTLNFDEFINSLTPPVTGLELIEETCKKCKGLCVETKVFNDEGMSHLKNITCSKCNGVGKHPLIINNKTQFKAIR